MDGAWEGGGFPGGECGPAERGGAGGGDPEEAEAVVPGDGGGDFPGLSGGDGGRGGGPM